jgi:hypothetical protein
MKSKFDLVKELMITGEVSKDWIIENILTDIRKDSRKEKIKRLFNE